LRDQWEASKKKLDDFEQRLSVFRGQNMGRLPEERENNYRQLTALQAQKLNLNMSMNRVSQEKLLDENQLRIYREQAVALKDSKLQERRGEERSEKLAEKDREIAQYEFALGSARERYKETHPDVQRLVKLLASANRERAVMVEQQETNRPASQAEQPINPQSLREQRELDAYIQRMQGLVQARDMEMEDYRKEAAELDTTIKAYEARIQSTPVGIKEYDQLTRDRDLAKREYEDLDRRLNASAMSTALQNRQHGERFEQMDPPSLPQTPVEPKRALISLLGSGVGLLVGLLMAAVREAKNSAVQSLKDIQLSTELPILASIPLVESNWAVRRRKRRAGLAWVSASAVSAAAMSASIAHYYATKI